MTDRLTSGTATDGQNELLQLFEQLTDLLMAGEQEECQRLMAEHPQYAQQLESVLPAVQLMHEVKSSDAGGMEAARHDPHLVLHGRLGDFQLIRQIGRGGMGVVYEAEQLLLGRRVALKVLPLAGMLDQRQRTRFENEARAAATLNHPHIVPIHFVGIERGIHFYAMQYVKGHSLAVLLQALRQGQSEGADAKSKPAIEHEPARHGVDTQPEIQAALSTLRTDRRQDYFRSIAKIGIEIAEALQHAHSHGIIHRDIKPSNIMFEASTGHCLITDFGLARLEGANNLTMTGDVVGSLRYAPPEQALGKQSIVDERVDIYSLGATLYELLALRPIRDAEDREALLQQVTRDRPKPLRSLDPSIPVDLETIVQKALEHDQADRYGSAEEMAEDLRRFRAGRMLVTRRPNIRHRLTKWLKRNPVAVLAAATALLLLLLGTSAAALLLGRERARTAEQRDQANSNLQLAIAALDEVHSAISSQWIPHDRNLSDTQTILLRRSAQLLTEIAHRFPPDTEFRAEAGLANLHAANANARILEFDAAQLGYRQARKLLTQALAIDPAKQPLRVSLAESEMHCADSTLAAFRFTQAREQYQSAAEHYRHLAAIQPANVDYVLSLVQIESELLTLDALDLNDQRVVRIGTELRARLTRITDSNPDNADALQLNLKVTRIVSESLRRLGKNVEAVSLCQDALKRGSYLLQDFQDDRDVARTVAAIKAELGRCLLALGHLEQAERNLRDALSQLRRSFIFDGTPKEFSFAYMTQKAPHDMMEPAAFVQYAKTQATLGELLWRIGQQDEALSQINDAVRTCVALIHLFPQLPRYVADAAECALPLSRLDNSADTQQESLAASLATLISEPMQRLSEQHELPKQYLTACAEVASYFRSLEGMQE